MEGPIGAPDIAATAGVMAIVAGDAEQVEGLVAQQRGPDSFAGHREIFRLIEKCETAKAVLVMRRHVRRGEQFALEHLRTIEARRRGPE